MFSACTVQSKEPKTESEEKMAVGVVTSVALAVTMMMMVL